MAKLKNESSLFPAAETLLSQLDRSKPQHVIVLLVPSHDRHNQPLAEAAVAQWTESAMKLFGSLFRGATAFDTAKGVYKDADGTYLWDNPKLIESYAEESAIRDPANLDQLGRFCANMGKTLDQQCIMLVIGTVMIYIDDYSMADG